MGFSKVFTEEVKTLSDIVRIVSDYVPLKKRGKNYVANCPFHSEKTPSFSVNPVMQIFHCFGCGVGGDVVGFIMRIEHCDFGQAVKFLAEKTGIPLPIDTFKPNEFTKPEDRETLFQINRWASEFFQNCLQGPEGRLAREYLDQRGITAATQQIFQLGYAPDRWDALLGHLKARNLSMAEIEQSGLVTTKEGNSGYYDRFRGRCMFPITDTNGKVIAFGGRLLGAGEPKYLNSPETLLYSKSRNLFGLSYAKEAIRRQGFVILVEGYFDFLLPYQEGIQNLVANLGTALTEQQVKLLSRYLDRPQIVVNYDGDNAGIAATKRSLEILLEQGYKVNVLSLPNGEDPDTFIRQHGSSEYRQLLKKSQPYLDYIIIQSIREHDITRPAGKVETLNAILPFLAKVRDRIERADYAGRIADRLKIDDKVVREELQKIALGQRSRIDSQKLAPPPQLLPVEKRLLKILLANAPLCAQLMPHIDATLYANLISAPIFTALHALAVTTLPVTFLQLTHWLADKYPSSELPCPLAEYNSLIAGLLVADEELDAWSEDQLMVEAQLAIQALQHTSLNRRLAVLQTEINQATYEGNHDQALQLLKQQFALRQELSKIHELIG
jgi:DNA primase